MSDSQKILVVALDNLGDLVFASAFMAQLHTALPHAELGVWCKDYAKDVADLLPGAPKVFAADPLWDRAPGRGKGSWGAFFRTLVSIRRHEFDTAIVCSRQWRAAAAVWAIGIEKRVGFNTQKLAPWLSCKVPLPENNVHASIELNSLMLPFGPCSDEARYSLDADRLRQLRQNVLLKRSQAGKTRPFIALHAFAGNLRRCAPLSIWLSVAEGILERGYAPMWIGTSKEQLQIRDQLGKDAEKFEYSSDYGYGRVREDAAVIAEATAFVGHDSGPLHIANALGVPVVGLYLPSTPLRTGPRGMAGSRLIAKASAADVSAEEILRALFDMLDKR